MTERERSSFLALKRHIIYDVQGGKCWNCDEPATDIAHRISKSKANLKKYGKGIIHHPLNVVGSCSRCNQRVLIDNRPIKIAHLVRQIIADISGVE